MFFRYSPMSLIYREYPVSCIHIFYLMSVAKDTSLTKYIDECVEIVNYRNIKQNAPVRPDSFVHLTLEMFSWTLRVLLRADSTTFSSRCLSPLRNSNTAHLDLYRCDANSDDDIVIITPVSCSIFALSRM